jgi:hypothetical protein
MDGERTRLVASMAETYPEEQRMHSYKMCARITVDVLGEQVRERTRASGRLERNR